MCFGTDQDNSATPNWVTLMHEKCNGKGAFFAIGKEANTGYIFGGYSTFDFGPGQGNNPAATSGSYFDRGSPASNAWIFRLAPNPLQITESTQGTYVSGYHLYSAPTYAPTWGGDGNPPPY